MSNEMTKEEILKTLEPLFEKAQKEGLWFFCNYQSLWFSPAELRIKHQEGKLVWGVVNWTLRNPNEHIKELEDELERQEKNIKSEILRFKARMIEA